MIVSGAIARAPPDVFLRLFVSSVPCPAERSPLRACDSRRSRVTRGGTLFHQLLLGRPSHLRLSIYVPYSFFLAYAIPLFSGCDYCPMRLPNRSFAFGFLTLSVAPLGPNLLALRLSRGSHSRAPEDISPAFSFATPSACAHDISNSFFGESLFVLSQKRPLPSGYGVRRDLARHASSLRRFGRRRSPIPQRLSRTFIPCHELIISRSHSRRGISLGS